jgi:hypothetical protein
MSGEGSTLRVQTFLNLWKFDSGASAHDISRSITRLSSPPCCRIMPICETIFRTLSERKLLLYSEEAAVAGQPAIGTRDGFDPHEDLSLGKPLIMLSRRILATSTWASTSAVTRPKVRRVSGPAKAPSRKNMRSSTNVIDFHGPSGRLEPAPTPKPPPVQSSSWWGRHTSLLSPNTLLRPNAALRTGPDHVPKAEPLARALIQTERLEQRRAAGH